MKTKILNVRLSDDEFKKIKDKALRLGLQPSAFLRLVGLSAKLKIDV